MSAQDPDLRIGIDENTPVIFNMYCPCPDERQECLPAHRIREHTRGVQPGKAALFLLSHTMLRRIMPYRSLCTVPFYYSRRTKNVPK